MSVLETLRGEVASGTVHIDEQRKIREIASPVGVIFALVPVTNPVPTIANKTLIALKGRNSIILSTHRMAKGVGEKTGEIIAEALARHGAPDGPRAVGPREDQPAADREVHAPRRTSRSCSPPAAPGWSRPPTRRARRRSASARATRPAWVSADADPVAAAQAIVLSKSFDNGLICGSEQHIVVDASLKDALRRGARGGRRGGAHAARRPRRWSSARSTTTGTCCSSTSAARRRCSRRWPGLESKEGASILVFPVTDDVPEEALGKERLAPVCSLFTVDGDDEAIALCRRLLGYEGAGHTAVIHTSDPEREARFATAIPAGRILVNVPATLGFCGVVTGLQPSFTLGCGTFGGNSTTDNVGYKNLLNVKRVAHPTT